MPGASLLVSGLLAVTLQAGAFGQVRALSVHPPWLVASTKGGIVVYDEGLQRFVARWITPEPVDLAVAEPGGQVVYFVMGTGLYRWVQGQPRYLPLTTLSAPVVSLGLGPRSLWLEYAGGRLEQRSLSGFRVEDGTEPPPEVVWCGRRAEVTRQDPRLSFLQPLKRWFPDVGEVDFTSLVAAWQRLYVGTRGLGVWIYDLRMTMALDSLNPGLWPGPVVALAATPEGTWWIATPEALNAWNGRFTRVIRAGARPDFPVAEIRACLWTPGALWVGTDRGVYRYQDDHFSWPSTPLGLARVNHLSTARGLLWVATENGAYRLPDGQAWLRGQEVYRLLPTQRGVVALTDRGVFLLEADSLPPRAVSDPRGWLQPGVSEVGVVYRDTLWIAGTDGLVIWLPGDTLFRYLPMPFAPAGQPLQDLAVNRRHLLVASAVSVYEYARAHDHWRPLPVDLTTLGTFRRVALNGDTLVVAGDRGAVFQWP